MVVGCCEVLGSNWVNLGILCEALVKGRGAGGAPSVPGGDGGPCCDVYTVPRLERHSIERLQRAGTLLASTLGVASPIVVARMRTRFLPCGDG